MLYIVCLDCAVCLRVSPGANRERDSLFARTADGEHIVYNCWSCEGVVQFHELVEARSLAELTVHDVSPQEAFAALHGLGLPSERECSPAAVREVMVGATIRSVGTRTIQNSHRAALEYIELENGTRIYVASGSGGAVIYRISQPESYVQKVIDELGG